MNTGELKDLFRLDVADPEEPGAGDSSESLWMDLEIYGYMDVAQKRFVRATDLFLDASTPAVTQITVTQDNPWVSVSPLIVKIRRATLNSTGRRLTVKKLQDMDAGMLDNDYGLSCSSNWETATGTPKYLITDADAGKARLAPIPASADQVNLTVYRLPLNTIVDDTIALEVTDEEYQRIMLLYMKHLAYSKQDTDVYDPALAERNFGLFNEGISMVNRQLRRSRHPASTTRYGGY